MAVPCSKAASRSLGSSSAAAALRSAFSLIFLGCPSTIQRKPAAGTSSCNGPSLSAGASCCGVGRAGARSCADDGEQPMAANVSASPQYASSLVFGVVATTGDRDVTAAVHEFFQLFADLEERQAL